jgi:hypothetical protein
LRVKSVGRLAITPKMIIVRTQAKINSRAVAPVEAPQVVAVRERLR